MRIDYDYEPASSREGRWAWRNSGTPLAYWQGMPDAPDILPSDLWHALSGTSHHAEKVYGARDEAMADLAAARLRIE